VKKLNSVLRMGQKLFVESPGNGYGPVLSSGTSDGDHQLVLSLQYIIRKKEFQHIIKLFHENISRPALFDEILHFLFLSGLNPQIFLVVRIRKKTDIKYQVCIR